MDITPSWSELLRDLAYIKEWAERFPNDDTEAALDWANAELSRIGEHLEGLPAEHRLALPSMRDHHAAVCAVREA